MMPTRHVDAVEAGEGVEGRAEDVRGVAQALPVEGRELVDLAADEDRAEERRGGEPHPVAPDVAPHDGGDGQRHGERAHEEHERAHRGERDVEDLVRRRAPPTTAVAQQQVGGDQGAEEQAVGAEEDPHAPASRWRGRWRCVCTAWRRVDGGGGISHRRPPPRPRRPPARRWRLASASSWSSWPWGGRSSSSGGSRAQPDEAGHHDSAADGREDQVEDQAVADERQAGGEHERPVRRRRQVGPRRRRPAWRPRRRWRPAPRAGLVLLVLAVPEVVELGDDRVVVEVVLGGGRRDAPLEAAGVPRVGPGGGYRWRACASSARCCRRTRGSATAMMKAPIVRHHVPEVEAVAVAVGRDPAAHALEAEDVHRAEGEVEADQGEPEVDLAQLLVRGSSRTPSATRSRSRRGSRTGRRRRSRSGSGRRCSRCRSAGCRPGATAWVTPDRPPMVNIATRPIENSIGVVKRELPAPHRGHPVEDLHAGGHGDEHRRHARRRPPRSDRGRRRTCGGPTRPSP